MGFCGNCGAPLNGSGVCMRCGAAQGGGFNTQPNMGFGGGGMSGFRSNSNQTRAILFWVGAIAAGVVGLGILINAIILIAKVIGEVAEMSRYTNPMGLGSMGMSPDEIAAIEKIKSAAIIGFIIYIILVLAGPVLSTITMLSGRKNAYKGNKMGIVTSASMLLVMIICLIIRGVLISGVISGASDFNMDNIVGTMIMAFIACVPGLPADVAQAIAQAIGLHLMDFAILGLVLYGISLAAHIVGNIMGSNNSIGGNGGFGGNSGFGGSGGFGGNSGFGGNGGFGNQQNGGGYSGGGFEGNIF